MTSSQPEAEPSVAAEPPVDISPILSALDAAEKQAQGTKPWSETPERGPAEQVQPPVEPPGLSTSRSRAESRPRIELPPERRLFGFYNAAPPPTPRDWPTEAEELPTPEVTAAGSVSAREPSSPPGMMQEGLAEFHQSGETPLPVGPAADAFDAAAKIAAEASAAAEALENLKRLLGSRAPNVEVTPPPVVTAPPPPPVERPVERFVERPVERPVERHEPAAVPPPIVARPPPPPMRLPNQRAMVLAELPPPMPMDFERDRKVGVVLRGFLAGLGLSLAAGVVLYLFMSAG